MRLGCAEIGVVNTQPTLVKRALRTLTLHCHAPGKDLLHLRSRGGVIHSAREMPRYRA
jgi:hypothetical protein